MKALATSKWRGTWKEGEGTLTTRGVSLKDVPYSFASRFGSAEGASPEELLAAAHAGCFNQALANNFGMLGLAADRIDTSLTVDVEIGEHDRPSIVGVAILVDVDVPAATKEQIEHCVERARTNCSIARVLRCPITAGIV